MRPIVCLSDPPALPATLYAVVRAYLPSLRSVLEQLPPGRGKRRWSIRSQET